MKKYVDKYLHVGRMVSIINLDNIYKHIIGIYIYLGTCRNGFY